MAFEHVDFNSSIFTRVHPGAAAVAAAARTTTPDRRRAPVEGARAIGRAIEALVMHAVDMACVATCAGGLNDTKNGRHVCAVGEPGRVVEWRSIAAMRVTAP